MTSSSSLPTGRPRTLDEAKIWLNDKLAARQHPMNLIDPVEGVDLIASLQGLDGASWAKVWGTAGDAARVLAEEAEHRDPVKAQSLYMKAYGLYFLGRFPCPNHDAKLRNAEKERDAYLAAGRFWPSPVQRVTVPFDGKPGEGTEVAFLYRRPAGVSKPSVVIMWGGVDAWKEQMTEVCDAFLAAGIATIAMDNVGTGESPVKGVVDAERQFLPVLAWAAAQADLDGSKPACLGRSFGGYWATKLAHQHPDHLAAAVNWGGGAHFMFQADWIEASRFPDSYLMELVETRKRMLGVDSDADYIAAFARLSLLDQGLLDQPCAPLLLVNGKFDKQCPVADIHLLTEHGSPKALRLFPGGHMGHTPLTLPTIVTWVAGQLSKGAA